MPIVQIEILKGRTVEQKKAMAKEVTEAICRTLDATPETVFVIIRDMDHHNFAKGGTLHGEGS